MFLIYGGYGSSLAVIVYTGFPVGFMLYITILLAITPLFNTVLAIPIINCLILIIGAITWFYASSLICGGIIDSQLLIISIIYRLLAGINFGMFIASMLIYTQMSNDIDKILGLFLYQIGAVIGFGLTGQLYRYILRYASQQSNLRIVTQIVTVPQVVVVPNDPIPVATPVPGQVPIETAPQIPVVPIRFWSSLFRTTIHSIVRSNQFTRF
jgi:hypothetical protein